MRGANRNVKAEHLYNELLKLEEQESSPSLKVHHEGAHNYLIEGDLKSAESDTIEDGALEWVEYHLNRDGIYHNLPEHLLLVPLEESNESAPKRAKRIKEQIEAWQKLFLPFDTAIFQASAAVNQIEDWQFDHLFKPLCTFWGLDRFKHLIDERQAKALLLLLPHAHKINGNLHYLSQVFSTILGDAISINTIPPTFEYLPDGFCPPLGTCSLNVDFVLGQKFTDGVPRLRILVKNLLLMEVEAYICNGRKLAIITEILAYYFFSGDQDWVCVLELEDPYKPFVLDEKAGILTYLGITTYF